MFKAEVPWSNAALCISDLTRVWVRPPFYTLFRDTLDVPLSNALAHFNANVTGIPRSIGGDGA